MHRTYELFVRQADGHIRFEPLTHPGPMAEVLAAVRALLEEVGAESIEVRIGGDHLFTLQGA